MEWFYIITTVLAIIFLIISLLFIGLLMKKNNKIQVFPASVAQCPDLWVTDGSYCRFNGKNNGSFAIDTTNRFLKSSGSSTYNDSKNSVTPFIKNRDGMDVSYSTINPFDDSTWTLIGNTPKCGQHKWATLNNIQWTGIREYNNC